MPIVRGRTFVAPSHLSVNTGQERWFYKREEMVFRKYQNVLVEDPDISSQAALVLLIQYYAERSNLNPGNTTGAWHRARAAFIAEHKKTSNEFFCFNCKKQLFEGRKPHAHDGVTVDHIVELKFGGSLTDLNNMRISCGHCNSARSNYGDS